VPAHRGELASAGLTIIRAYLAAGEPKQSVPNFARFEDWQRLCRFPLTWLVLADSCATRRCIEASDPVREGLRALLAAWHRQFGNRRATIKAAIEAAVKAGDLQTAMEAVAGEKGGINARRAWAGSSPSTSAGSRAACGSSGTATREALFWRVADEFPEFFSTPSREEKSNRSGNGSGDGTQIDQWGRNSENSENSFPPVPVEVEL
jgi:hypothetical protein